MAEDLAKIKKPVTREEYDRNVQTLANLETIRVNQFVPFNLHYQKAGSLDTTSQDLDSDVFEAGYIYIITSICAWCDGTGTPQIHLGIVDGATFFRYEVATVGNAEDSVEYVGQLMCKETDKIRARFEGATANDTAHLYINGYKIRR